MLLTHHSSCHYLEMVCN